MLDNTRPAVGGMQALVVGSLNCKVELPLGLVQADYAKFAGQVHPDIAGLQEFRGSRKNFMKDNVFRGYSYLQFQGEGADRNPVIWRSQRFDLLHSEPLKLSDAFYFTKAGKRINNTWGTLVVLRDRWTGRVLHHLNTHTPPAVQGLKGQPSKVARRVANLEESLTTIAAYAVTQVAPEDLIFVTGDLNWDSERDGWSGTPEAVLKRHGLSSQFAVLGESKGKDPGTLNTRDIDYIFTKHQSKGTTEFQRRGIVTGLATDHNGSWAACSVKNLPGVI